MRPILTLALALLSLTFVGCDSAKKANYSGRWISKETLVDKGIINSDKTNVVERTLTLEANGKGEFLVKLNGKNAQVASGNWAVQADILYLDHEAGKTLYMRVIRITNERLVIRNQEGVERIYDRLQ
jgi:hypothetical protein